MRLTSSMAVVAGAAGGLLLLAACSSFSAAPPPGEDAGEAGGALDALPDAPLETDGPPSAFCAAHLADPGLLYCNDLEAKTAPISPFGFTGANVSDAGAAVVQGDAERLAILRVELKTVDTNLRDVSLRQALGPRLSGFRLDFDIKILTNDLTSVTLADLHLAGTTCEASFGLGAFDGKTLGGTRSRDPAPKPYESGTWLHVSVALVPTAGSSTGYREVTSVDGETLVDREAHASSGSDATLKTCTNADLRIGISEVGASTGALVAIVHYDNIIVHELK